MRYMIRAEVSIEAGDRIDRSSGGPGKAIAAILESLKPETFYVSIFKREMFLIVNTDDAALLSEAAHLFHLACGTNLEVTPILTSAEATAIIPRATENAVKTTKALGL